LSGSKIARLNDFVYRLGPIGNPEVLSSYLLMDDKVAVVDCGPGSAIGELEGLIEECGVSKSQIDYLLLTHIHLDHAGGSARFLENFHSAKLIVPERGLKHLLNPEVLNSSARSILGDRIFNNWGECAPVPVDKARSVKANDTINLGHLELEYVPAPGHAPHHNVIVDKEHSIIFTADALGIYEEKSGSLIPTTPPPSFDLIQALKDINTVKTLRPIIACMAHFKEISPDGAYFAKASRVFRAWASRASEDVEENKLTTYDQKDCERLFSNLQKDFPEYTKLSDDLKDQVTRVDAGGFLNYYLKAR
jgi:glyoxylase-like metal-dependent hydrolase (beta-lactamase superfamily II)